jgi:hypothetical protein
MKQRIDGPVPLSQSVLWRSLRAFYEAQGPAAFTSGMVPWRITSCPLLAAAYADAAAGFVEDVASIAPLQVLELGGGTGRLAFHLMRALEERGIPFRYRFTDGSASTVAAAAQHRQLRPWIDRGLLACEQLDALAPQGLRLGQGPALVVANYLFDSLPHDAWRAEAGVPSAQHVEVWTQTGSFALDQTGWNFVDAKQVPEPGVLGYSHRVGSGRFLWPSGPLACVQAVAKQLRRPQLWLIADKGPGTLEQVRGQDTTDLARHGCISAMVNFDALRAWAGWRPFLAPEAVETRFGMYGWVEGWRRTPRLRKAWKESGEANLPLQALSLLDQLATEASTLPQLLQALAFTRFDPDTLVRISALLRGKISGETSAEHARALVAALDATWANHFAVDEHNDLAFEIATVLHRAGQLSHAVGYYQHSIALRGAHAATFFNLALCLLDLGRVAEAREALQSTLKAAPAHPRAMSLLAATG